MGSMFPTADNDGVCPVDQAILKANLMDTFAHDTQFGSHF